MQVKQMAKTDVPNDTQTKQTPEEWAVRRAMQTLHPQIEDDEMDYDEMVADYHNTPDDWSFVSDVALSFMQLREECAVVCDEAVVNAMRIKDLAVEMQDRETIRNCEEGISTATILGCRIRNLHTNG